MKKHCKVQDSLNMNVIQFVRFGVSCHSISKVNLVLLRYAID